MLKRRQDKQLCHIKRMSALQIISCVSHRWLSFVEMTTDKDQGESSKLTVTQIRVSRKRRRTEEELFKLIQLSQAAEMDHYDVTPAGGTASVIVYVQGNHEFSRDWNQAHAQTRAQNDSELCS